MHTIYINTKKIALIITLIVLLLGSVFYFSTNIDERNNEMMYKEIYGENVTIPENAVTNYTTEFKPVLV